MLTDCGETRQSHKRGSRQGSSQPMLEIFLFNILYIYVICEECIGVCWGSAGAGRCLGAARSPLFSPLCHCHVLHMLALFLLHIVSIVMKPDSRTNMEDPLCLDSKAVSGGQSNDVGASLQGHSGSEAVSDGCSEAMYCSGGTKQVEGAPPEDKQ